MRSVKATKKIKNKIELMYISIKNCYISIYFYILSITYLIFTLTDTYAYVIIFEIIY